MSFLFLFFSLPHGVRGWLRLLLVALPGLFGLPFSVWGNVRLIEALLASGFLVHITHLMTFDVILVTVDIIDQTKDKTIPS